MTFLRRSAGARRATSPARWPRPAINRGVALGSATARRPALPGRRRAPGCQVDHVAIDGDAVGRRQQEAAAHLRGLGQRQAARARRRRRCPPPARTPAPAPRPCMIAADGDAGQGEHHRAVGARAVGDQPALGRLAEFDHDAGAGRVAAKANAERRRRACGAPCEAAAAARHRTAPSAAARRPQANPSRRSSRARILRPTSRMVILGVTHYRVCRVANPLTRLAEPMRFPFSRRLLQIVIAIAPPSEGRTAATARRPRRPRLIELVRASGERRRADSKTRAMPARLG